MNKKNKSRRPDSDPENLELLALKIRPDLYRAFRRCTWIIIHETGRSQLEVFNEMVEDFLKKHGC